MKLKGHWAEGKKLEEFVEGETFGKASIVKRRGNKMVTLVRNSKHIITRHIYLLNPDSKNETVQSVEHQNGQSYSPLHEDYAELSRILRESA